MSGDHGSKVEISFAGRFTASASMLRGDMHHPPRHGQGQAPAAEDVTLDDVLQPGTNMLAAGYCMYGSSFTLVWSTGNGVNGFTLDPSLGEFILTHPNIKIPKKGKIYSVNEGNAKNWDVPTTKYVEKCKFPQDGSSPKSLRYIVSANEEERE